MDEMLSDQIEWLISCNLQGNRLARHLLILSGCLADDVMPEKISRQMSALSRQVLLQEGFDALVAVLNQFSRIIPGKPENNPINNIRNIDLTALLAQIEDARQQLAACEPVNYAEIIAWITAQARARKLWRRSRTR